VCGEADFTEAAMEGVHAENADFSGSVFRYAKLSQGVFSHAKFVDCDLSVADARANFNDADLTGADLRGTKMEGAILRNAILSNAKLAGANLNGADLSHATFDSAQLELAQTTGIKGRSRLEAMKKQKKNWWQFWG
jgi:uncharacterized protein YjbI with pentapeptide repeats